MREDKREYERRPDYALGPHVAALGLVFSDKAKLGDAFTSGAFVGRHGSWNRKPASGYDVVFVPFNDKGQPTAKPVNVLSGFLTKDGKAKGRPTMVVLDKSGALLVSDDVGNIIWRVSKG
jgi:glucose/arabinose dehydrogenase